MSRLTAADSRRGAWLAVTIVVTVLTAALAVWFYVSLPSGGTQVSPLHPWFFVEGANASWDVRRRNDGIWRNETATMAVLNVSQDYILLRMKVNDSYLDHPLPMSELFDFYTTLAAASEALKLNGFEVQEYGAEIGVFDLPFGSLAALRETASSFGEPGVRVFSERLVVLPDLLLLREETTTFLNVSGSSHEFYDVRSLIRVEGLSLLAIGVAARASTDVAGERVTFELFNGDAVQARTEAGSLILDLESRSPSVLASIVRRNLFVSVADPRVSMYEALWPLNDTHALIGLKLESGRYRLAFDVAETPSGVAGSDGIVTRREDSTHSSRDVGPGQLRLTLP